jgi:hypothetical protein
MHLDYTPEQERLRQELRAYFAGLMTAERRAALGTVGGEYGSGQAYRDVVRQLGREGWLALSWPPEYGGRGGSLLDQLIFTDEAAVAGVPVPFLTINTVGPTIMRFGTEEQKAQYLPRIAGGEVHFSIGYSEPEAGTDLASLRTRAVRDGDSYVINGQKMWTSLIQYADYVWLACRTDPEARRHKGLSILIVPTDAAGFSWTPVRTVAGTTTSATYYSDVRVPVSALVGEENRGWPLITNQLNHERVALTSSAPLVSSQSSPVSARATDMPRWPKGPALRFEMPKPAAVVTSRPAAARNGMYLLLPSVNRRNLTCSFLGTMPPGPKRARRGLTVLNDRLAHTAPLSSGKCRDAPLAALDRCWVAAVGPRRPPAGPAACAGDAPGLGRRNVGGESSGITNGTLGSIPVQTRRSGR